MLGAIPGGIAGVLLDDLAEQTFRSPLLIAGTLSLMALALLAADRLGATDRELGDIGPLDALLIGAAQALAIVPGVSRSGITIAVARVRGIERAAAARFSFLLGVPLIAGAAFFKLRHLADTPVQRLTYSASLLTIPMLPKPLAACDQRAIALLPTCS